MQNPFPSNQKIIIPSERFGPKTLLFILGLYAMLRLVSYIIFPEALTQASDLSAANILSAINKERQLRNLLTLNTDNRLSSAAQSKAADMLARKYFSHTDPDGNYIWPKIEAAGYTPYLQLGENLAVEFYDTESMVEAWMNSPTHRANILNEGFKDQGMGLDFGSVSLGQYYSVAVNTFGTLLAKPRQQTAAATPPASAPPPPAATEPPKPKPAPAPAPQPTPTPAAVPPRPATSTIDLAIRGNEPAKSPAATTAEKQQSMTSPAADTLTAEAVTSSQKPKLSLDQDQVGRYLTIGLGAVLLVLLLSDLKVALNKKTQKLDKKINNLALLLLAIVVVALMYLF